MRTMFSLFVAISFMSLTGCQLLNLIWPQNAPIEIEEVIPEIPDEILQEAENLEEASDFYESITGEQPSISVVPIGEFTLNYFLNYTTEFMNAKSSLLETITLKPDLNQSDYINAIYYFDETYEGKQSAELAGQDEGVICWTMFEHQVEYHVFGSFDPSTCTIKVVIEAEPKKTVETGSSCPHYPAGLLTLDQLFIATPDSEIAIMKMDTIYTYEVWHQLKLSNFKVPVEGINCPMD